jgi:hypothetical protein
MAVAEDPALHSTNQLVNWALLKKALPALRAEPAVHSSSASTGHLLEHKSCDSSRISPGSDYLVKTCSAKYDV